MKHIYLILSLCCVVGISAQVNQNANWMLAEQGGLNFMASPPTTLTSNISAMGAAFSSASVSDQQGNLLFYTDGFTVWDESGSVMPNGTDLKGQGGDFNQNIVIVPNPDNIDKYYIVYISVGDGATGTLNGLLYSEVDTALGIVNAATRDTPLNDDNGDPIDAFNPINYGKITSARHSNGMDYWLIAEVGPRIFTYLVDDSGIHFSNQYASPLPVAMYTVGAGAIGSSNGPMKISPDNSHILIGYSVVDDTGPDATLSRLYVGLFDDSTGDVGTWIRVNTPTTYLELEGAEFSPNSQIVHRTYGNQIASSEVTFDGTNWSEGTFTPGPPDAPEVQVMQRAMNGKIYFDDTDFGVQNADFIAVIDNPDGPLYGISYNAVDYNSMISTYNSHLPQWVHWQTCWRTLTTNALITASRDRERVHWIRSTDIFDGASVIGRYHAGDFVELNPGFETQNNAGFVAYIHECDGNYTYKQPVVQPQIKEMKNPVATVLKSALLVYPNPSSSQITISSETEILSEIEMFSVDVKLVLKKLFNSYSQNVDVSGFGKGIYLIKAKTASGKTLTSKFIKN